MVTTILKVIGGALAFLGFAWLYGTHEQQTYRQRKEELDELSHAHFGKPFDELDGPEERGTILMLYGEGHDEYEEQEQFDKETADRVKGGLDDLALTYYGKPFDELDSIQQRAVMAELKKQW